VLDIIALTIWAVICGADSWVDGQEYGQAKHDWLKSIPAGDLTRRLDGRVHSPLFLPAGLEGGAAVGFVTVVKIELLARNGQVRKVLR
jgi:hypothetical protein